MPDVERQAGESLESLLKTFPTTSQHTLSLQGQFTSNRPPPDPDPESHPHLM